MKLTLWAALGISFSNPGAALATVSSEARQAAVKSAASSAEAKDLQYFVGSWVVTARDPDTNNVMSINYRVEPLVGGLWLAGRGESADRSIAARDSWGIDPATRQVVRFVFDSSGAYGIVRAPGWAGDRMVLTGEAHSKGGPTKVRETITRHGQDRFEAVWEAMVNGVWKAYSIEEARRQ